MLSLFCPSAMAAATGRTRRRRSKRTAAAYEFLSNISLDGSLTRDVPTPSNETTVHGKKCENIAPVERSDPACQVNLVVGRGRKLLHSISESAAGNSDQTRVSYIRGRSVTSTAERGNSDRAILRRTVSLVESSGDSSSELPNKQRISCLSAASFNVERGANGRANDKRIVFCSSHKVPFFTYSVLKYHKENQEAGQEGMGVKQGQSSHCDGIEGVEVGSQEKTISFSPFLVPAYPNGWEEQPEDHKLSASVGSPMPHSGLLTVQAPVELVTHNPGSSHGRGLSFVERAGDAVPRTNSMLYDPLELDNPELVSGRHRTVLSLSSYLVSIIAYAKPSELKKDLNEQVREKFPNLDISLTKLRSLKKDMLKLATSQESQLDLATVAYGFAYFEKLILKEKVNKGNRKVLAGACLLLAAKFNDDRKVEEIKDLIEEIDDRFRVPVKDLIKFELQALVALEFNLHIPRGEVLPHLKRLESDQQ